MKSLINKIILTSLITLGINNSYSQNSKFSEDSKLLIYGEPHHVSILTKEFVINSIDSLKKEGYNYFAIELDRGEYNPVQSYLKSDKKYRDSEWDSSASTEKLLEMIYNFYKKGYKVIPIDTNVFSEWEFIGDSILNRREFHMAEKLEEITKKDSSAKIVAFVGGIHAIKSGEGSIAVLLKKRGINSETIYLMDNKLTNQKDRLIAEYFDKIIYLNK